MLGDILEQISLIDLHSHGLIAPDMLAAPIPAFPAIGLPGLQRIATAKVEEVCLRSMGRVDDLRLAMTVRLAQNRKRAIGVVDALYLVRDQLRRLIPANLDILGLAPVLGVSLAVRIPIDALHRMQNAILGIDSLLVADGTREESSVFSPGSKTFPLASIFHGLRSSTLDTSS